MARSGVIVVGDIHGEWAPLNALIAKKKPDIILQTGDFGFWPKWHNTRTIGTVRDGKKWDQYGLKPGDTKIYWCDGNHSDHWALKDLVKSGNLEIQPNVFYQPRGSILTLPDGRNVLFMGGADSIDKEHRKLGIDWFPDEVLTEADVYSVPDDSKIDIVISHTGTVDMCGALMKVLDPWKQQKNNDPSRLGLQFIFERFRPTFWYFGHFHMFMSGSIRGCHWTTLDMPQHVGRW
jgi:hypothetical protein